MNLKKHKLLTVSTVLFVVLLGAAVFFLIRFQSSYRSQKQELDSQRNRLASLNKRNPFPSEDNLEVLQSNTRQLEGSFSNLVNRLRNGQVEPLPLESARFPTLLARTASRIREGAAQANVLIPEDFYFGFERYADGSLPPADSVETLTVQIQMIESLVDLMYRSGVKSLISVDREELETQKTQNQPPSLDRRGSRGREVPGTAAQGEEEDDSDLFSRQSFTLTFNAGDAAVWNLMNGLASNQMFTVIENLTLSNPAEPDASAVPLYKGQNVQRETGSRTRRIGTRAMRQPATQPQNPFARGNAMQTPPEAEVQTPETQTAPVASHEERIVAGREWVEVVLKIDVYRFTAGMDGDEQEGVASE